MDRSDEASAVAAMVSGLLFFRALIALCMGDLSKVQALIGPRTLKQEVEQESQRK